MRCDVPGGARHRELAEDERFAVLHLGGRGGDEAVVLGGLTFVQGRERAATGALKDALFSGDVPPDHDAAVAYLMRVKDDALAAPAGEET